MTEADWDVGFDCNPMMDWLCRRACRQRKLRLFFCARGFDLWNQLTGESLRDALLTAEAFAEDLVSESELEAAQRSLRDMLADQSWRSAGQLKQRQRQGIWSARHTAEIVARVDDDRCWTAGPAPPRAGMADPGQGG